MKKRIFAAALAVSVMLSMIAFASCNGNGEAEDLGEMMDITVTVRVVGDNNHVLIEGREVRLENYASMLTVMAATRHALEIYEIPFTPSGETGFTAIGPYVVDLEYRVDVYDEDDEEDEPEENGENGGNGEEEDHADLIWVVTHNGRDSTGTALLADGDSIEWSFVDSGF